MSEKHFVCLDITGFSNNGKRLPISRVTLMVDNENAVTAGDDTGLELSADCPHATQAMVESILSAVKGYQYQAYSADDANIDPAAELGDGITVSGVYSVISRFDDDGSGYVGISAPGQEELEDEYPAAGPMAQEFNRKIAQTYSEIKKTSDAIELNVTNLSGDVTSLKVAFGAVTISGPNGETRIKGSSIETDSLILTGRIQFGDLAEDAKDQINDAYTAATDAQTELQKVLIVSGGQTYIDGSMIYANSIYADAVHLGGDLAIYDSLSSSNIGGYLGYTTSANDGSAGMHIAKGSAEVAVTGNGARMSIPDEASDPLSSGSLLNQVYISSARFGAEVGGYTISFSANDMAFAPSSSDIRLGLSGSKWGQIYSTNSVISTSDRNEKKDITYDLSAYGPLFLRLRPCIYRFINGTSGRLHTGFIAQDVEEEIYASGLTSMDLAAFIKSPRSDGGYDYGMRYEEIVPLNTYMIQEIIRRLDALEDRING